MPDPLVAEMASLSPGTRLQTKLEVKESAMWLKARRWLQTRAQLSAYDRRLFEYTSKYMSRDIVKGPECGA